MTEHVVIHFKSIEQTSLNITNAGNAVRNKGKGRKAPLLSTNGTPTGSKRARDENSNEVQDVQVENGEPGLSKPTRCIRRKVGAAPDGESETSAQAYKIGCRRYQPGASSQQSRQTRTKSKAADLETPKAPAFQKKSKSRAAPTTIRRPDAPAIQDIADSSTSLVPDFVRFKMSTLSQLSNIFRDMQTHSELHRLFREYGSRARFSIGLTVLVPSSED